jgi:phospholipid/cholesterol/gamma-HCH transport system substrate-binding protein
MEGKAVAKVGSLVLVALLVFAALYLALAHLNPNTYLVRVRFDDTRGLLRQSVVRMQGVAIGEVKSIELNTDVRPFKPVVTLAIKKEYSIPQHSKFVIVSGLLITNPQVEVYPSAERTFIAQENSPIQEGSPSAGPLEALSPELQQIVTKFNTSFDELNAKFDKAYVKIDRILDQTNTLLASTNDTIKTARGFIGDPRLKAQLLESVDNLRAVTADARVTSKQLSKDLRGLVASSRGKLDRLSDNLLDLLTKIGNTVDEANTVVAKLTEQVTDPRLQQSLQETVELARTTLARFNQIASDIHQLTGDPQVQGDLKVTVAKLRATTEQGQQVVEKVNTLLGNVVGPGGKVHRPRIPKPEITADVSEQFDPSRLRVDLSTRFGLGARGLLDLGLYDLGQNTRLNLQMGDRLTDTLTARYGLYASKIGAGLDWQAAPGVGFRADLWDTNRPRLDVRGLFGVNSDASIWIGAEGLFRRPVPVIGVQFRH